MTRTSPSTPQYHPFEVLEHEDGSATMLVDPESPHGEMLMLFRDIISMETGRELTLTDALALACKEFIRKNKDAPPGSGAGRPDPSTEELLQRLRNRKYELLRR